MRRRSQPKPESSTGISFPWDIKKNLKSELLAEIGAVALAWNEVESLIDALLRTGLDLSPELAFEVTSRINGQQGKIAIIKAMLTVYPPANAYFIGLAGKTLAAVELYKKYRDGIIHSRLDQPNQTVATTAQRRGSHDEVLLTVPALSGLYERLVLVRDELIMIRSAYDAYLIDLGYRRYAYVVETGKTTSEIIQRYVSLLESHHTLRESLEPLPPFPRESPDPQPRAKTEEQPR